MKKIETVWCQLLYQVLEQRQVRFKQQELASGLELSLSTVNHALRDLRQMGAVKIGGKGGQVVDAEKILMHWANRRRLSEDIVETVEVDGSVVEAEGLLPPASILGGYSAVRMWYGEAPADYNTVYVYHKEPEVVRERFKGMDGRGVKMVILKLDPRVATREETTSLGHTFVDLWNVTEWMAKEFARRVKEEIDGLLS